MQIPSNMTKKSQRDTVFALQLIYRQYGSQDYCGFPTRSHTHGATNAHVADFQNLVLPHNKT